LVALEVRELVKRYGPTLGVGPVSVEVREGEFLSLLGPSGCGKTTTLRCIAGFEDPTSGDILMDGQSIVDRPPHRRDIGLVFQSYALFPHLTVFDNVAFGLKLRRWPKGQIAERVEESLRLVDLMGLEGRYPAQLSGGQQQRVALGRSLALQPRILLLDEPLSNLDLKLRVQMRSELRALQRRLRKTTIYVTHDQAEALSLSDRIVVLARGLVEQVGAPREIYEAPRTPFVADFIGASNLLAGEAAPVDAAPGVAVRAGGMRLLSLDPLPAEAGPRGEVFALVRPERIRLARAGEEAVLAENVLPGRVLEVIYLGQDLQVALEVEGGPVVTVSMKGGLADKDPTPGDAMTATIAARDVRLLPRAGAPLA
jgi:spermidine/putrescine ABC transporter ATP-binding subunit